MSEKYEYHLVERSAYITDELISLANDGGDMTAIAQDIIGCNNLLLGWYMDDDEGILTAYTFRRLSV